MKIRGKLSSIGLEGNCLTLSITEFIRDSGQWLTMPFFSLYFTHPSLGGSIVTLAILSLIRALTAVVFLFILGPLSDRIGRKKPIVIGGFISAIGPLINAIAPNWTFLILGQIIESFQSAYTWNVREALFMDSIKPEKKGIGVASFHTTMQIGSIFMPVMGGILSENIGIDIGMRIAYLYYSLTQIIQSLINAKFLKDTVLEKSITAKEQKNNNAKMSDTFSNSVKTLFQPIRVHRMLGVMLVGAVSSTFAMGLVSPFMAIYATSIIGMSKIELGLISSSAGVINLSTQIPFGLLTDRFGRRNFVLVSYFTRSFWILLFTTSRNFSQALFFSSLDTLSTNIGIAAWQVLIADNTSPEDRGRVYATFGTVQILSSSMSPSVGAFLWEAYGPNAPFYLDSIIRGLAALFLLRFFKE